MVLSIIFLEDKHNILLHLSIFYEYQQFFQHRICFSIQPPDYSDPWPTLARITSFFLIMLFKYLYVCLHGNFLRAFGYLFWLFFTLQHIVLILMFYMTKMTYSLLLVLWMSSCLMFYVTKMTYSFLLVLSECQPV
jgi:hypothetical protein